MPRVAAARKPAPVAPPVRKKAKPRPRKAVAKPKARTMTPTEHQKVMLGGLLLATLLLGLALHSGELLPTDDGWSVHFHDLRGAVVLNIELSFHHWPRIAFH